MKSALSLTLIICLVTSAAPVAAQARTEARVSFGTPGPGSPLKAGPDFFAIPDGRAAVEAEPVAPAPRHLDAAIRRESKRMATAEYVNGLASNGSAPGNWKCRSKWAVIGAAAGAVIVAAGTQNSQNSLGPSRGSLVLLAAVAGGVIGLVAARCDD
jgi:hypothetical protein